MATEIPATIQPTNTGVNLFGYGGPKLVLLLDDPTVDGKRAPVGSLGLYQVDGVGRLYLKSGAANTAWTQIT